MSTSKKTKHKAIPMSAVKSSSISEAGYDAATKTLAVKFANGGVYHYAGVTQASFDALGKAKSFGALLRTSIIGKHKHVKL